jgi:hypothetical protein
MDIEVILDTAEAEAPGLRDLAQRFLEADAANLGVPLDVASVQARRGTGAPEVHVTGAADLLLEHLVTVEPNPLSDGSALMALARAGAMAMMTRAEQSTRRSTP